MRPFTRTVAYLVVLVTVAGAPVGLTSQGAKPSIPAFDGTLILITDGGESSTSDPAKAAVEPRAARAPL
jgi:hypothetical protein